MEEIYVTLTEAAELENVNYETMKKKVQRDSEKYLAISEKKQTGGKPNVKVALSSLSGTARKLYKERQKLQEIAADNTDETESSEDSEMPWYVTVDVNQFQEQHKKEWYKAIELGNIIRDFLKYDEKGRVEYAEKFAQERLKKGKRTLYRYVKAYLEALAWADKLEKEDGKSRDYLKILALCRKPKENGNFPSFSPAVKQAIKNIWFNEDFARNQGTREMLYEALKKLQKANARVEGWEKIPSYQSVVRYISFLMEDEEMKNAWLLASRGVREYKNRVMGKALMDTTCLKPMEVVMGDEHTFDCWVAYKHSNGKVTPIKPVLVAWIDVRSRRILGDVVCHHANSSILQESLLKLINTEGCGVPQYLLIDNGKDYTAEIMTGVPRAVRNIEDSDYVDATHGFYAKLGIEHIHRALPYQPWTKGQIERFFGGVCSRFTKWMTSYTGTLTGSKTDAKIPKDIQKMCERGELLTMEEFYAKWAEWVHEKYEKSVHRGLKDAGEVYKKPIELFEHVERYYKAAPPKSAQLVFMYKEDNVRIRNYGFKRYGKVYDHPALRTHINETVSIRYDKNDISTIFVIGKNGKTICEAECQELLAFGTHVSEEALVKHIKKQNQQLKADRRLLEEATRPFEEMNEEYVGFSSTVGGIDLMIGKKPEKKDNVVSMPLDRAYRNGFRGKDTGEEQEADAENAYISKNAEKALSKLRAL